MCVCVITVCWCASRWLSCRCWRVWPCVCRRWRTASTVCRRACWFYPPGLATVAAPSQTAGEKKFTVRMTHSEAESSPQVKSGVPSHLQFGVLFLQRLHCVRDLLPGLHPLIGLLDQMIHPFLRVQPIGGVLQHVVKLLRPVWEFGLRVLPVSLKPVDYNDSGRELFQFRVTVCVLVHCFVVLCYLRDKHIDYNNCAACYSPLIKLNQVIQIEFKWIELN